MYVRTNHFTLLFFLFFLCCTWSYSPLGYPTRFPDYDLFAVKKVADISVFSQLSQDLRPASDYGDDSSASPDERYYLSAGIWPLFDSKQAGDISSASFAIAPPRKVCDKLATWQFFFKRGLVLPFTDVTDRESLNIFTRTLRSRSFVYSEKWLPTISKADVLAACNLFVRDTATLTAAEQLIVWRLGTKSGCFRRMLGINIS
jgi:hypothetical protein